MLAKRHEIESRLEVARDELAVAEAELATIDADESAAIGSPAAHAAWRAKRGNAAGEVERLQKVIAILEPAADEHSRAEAEANLRRRHAQQIVANAELAKRIRQEVAKANAILLPLVHDVAKAAQEDRQVNGSLLDDLEPIISADLLARSKPALARTEIGRERVLLWVKTERPDYIVGYQDEVEDRGNGMGRLTVGVSTFPVFQRAFEKISYYPEQAAPQVVSLLTMRLPCADEPGFCYDGSNFPERAALGVLNRAEKPRERSVEIELEPVDELVAGD